MMSFGGGMQAVEGFRGDTQCGIEAEGNVSAVDVVIDRLGNTNDGYAFLVQLMCNTQGSIAAQHEHSVELQTLNSFDDLVRDINGHFLPVAEHFPGIRIPAICRAQNRSTARQYSTHGFQAQTDDAILFDETIISVADAEDVTIKLIDGRLHRRADHGIQSRRIGAACQDSDSFYGLLLC